MKVRKLKALAMKKRRKPDFIDVLKRATVFDRLPLIALPLNPEAKGEPGGYWR